MTSMAKASTTSDQTRMGMMFAETDDELAYLVFVAPDYPERVAKQLVDKHARAVESMASDGARTRATCHTLPARAREGSTPPCASAAPRHAAALLQAYPDARVPQAHSTAGKAQTRAGPRRRRMQRCARRWRRSAYPARTRVPTNRRCGVQGRRAFTAPSLQLSATAACARSSTEHALTARCWPRCRYEGGDKVSQVMREVDQVKGVMSDNINQAMNNLESTEVLNEKASEMKAQSNMFNKQAKTAKNQMWWKNMKLNIIIAAVVLLIIAYIVLTW